MSSANTEAQTAKDQPGCPSSPQALVKQFNEQRPLYEAFTTRLRTLLEDLLDAASIRSHLIEGRTKDAASLAEKVCRPGKTYRDSISDVPDLSGLRVIAYYIDDIERITDLIKREFDVDLSQSADKRDLLEENEFGYLSVHFVIQLDEQRASQMEWKRFAGMKAEIQVRTVLQHAWAAISHTLEYKSKHDIPKDLRRKLYRLCGIFELADEEFLSLKEAHLALASRINQMIAEDSLEIDVTPESLARYIDHSGVDGDLAYAAERLEWDVVPFCHANRMEDYSDLRAICELTGIASIREFDVVVKELLGLADEYLHLLAEASPGPWSVSPLFVLQMLTLVHRGSAVDLDEMLDHADWDRETAETVLAVARSADVRSNR